MYCKHWTILWISLNINMVFETNHWLRGVGGGWIKRMNRFYTSLASNIWNSSYYYNFVNERFVIRYFFSKYFGETIFRQRAMKTVKCASNVSVIIDTVILWSTHTQRLRTSLLVLKQNIKLVSTFEGPWDFVERVDNFLCVE